MASNPPSGRHAATRPTAAHARKSLFDRPVAPTDDIETFLVKFDPLEQRRRIREGMEAAIIAGGRWNPSGIWVLYACCHASTALLEALVHMAGCCRPASISS